MDISDCGLLHHFKDLTEVLTFLSNVLPPLQTLTYPDNGGSMLLRNDSTCLPYCKFLYPTGQ